MYNTAERKFAQALVTQLNDEFNRAHGKEMHLTPTQLLFAAKHTIEVLLTDITVLETERALRDAPPAAPRVERYGDGVLVHWPEGVEQYIGVGDCVTGNLATPPAAAVPEGYALVQKWREQANAALRRSGTWNGNDMADRIEHMADELAAMLAAALAERNNTGDNP